MSTFAQVIFLAILAGILLAQPSPPAVGIQLGRFPEWEVRFPLTVTQCEPVFIYYNTTARFNGVGLSSRIDIPSFLLIGYFPVGVGYVEWICNIPAGYGFWAGSAQTYPIVVQPGSLSSCLRDITTTYQYATYTTAAFQSYTAGPPTPLAPPPIEMSDYLATYAGFHPCCFLILTSVRSTVPFPTGSFSTITVKCEHPFLPIDIWNPHCLLTVRN
jgi:hypothetical protein